MSRIEVFGKSCILLKSYAKKVAKDVVTIMKQPESLEVAIEFVSEEEIRRLNREIRNIDKVTDVLSFPATETKAGEIFNTESEEVACLVNEKGYIHFGDMALCLAQAKRQAKEYGVSLKSEVKKLIIHSMLHLMGYDHIKDEDYEVMHEIEDRLFKLI